jgi:hypothetical protein
VGPDAGTYVIQPLAASANLDNFEITEVNGSYTINKAAVTVTAGSGSGDYNGAPQSPSACTPSGVFIGDLTCTNNPTAIGPNANTFVITPLPASANLLNFEITPVNGSYTINKVPLMVTASSHSIIFGAPVPTITPSYTGFVGGDDPTDLTTAPNCSTTYTVGSLIGHYPTTCSTATSGNYNISYTAGDVSVLTACSAFNGFLPPIGGNFESGTGGSFNDPVRAFKLNSTIPVKFSATCYSAPLLTGIHTLKAIKYSDSNTADAEVVAVATDSATSGNQFRLSGSEWHFNLATKALGNAARGIWLLEATLFDGSKYTVWIEIKK